MKPILILSRPSFRFNFIVARLLECFKNTDTAELVRYITRTVKRYKLEPGAKEAYLKLRDKYNATPLDRRDLKMLYVLIMYGFNQQIRFNSSYDCNNPVGPAGFNDVMLSKLISFCRRMQEQNLLICSGDFEKMEQYFEDGTFLYCDPPYLITLGSYNDGKRGFNGWDESDEKRLYAFLNKANRKGIKFMLSNVLDHNGKHNDLLDSWIKENNYNVIEYSKAARKGRKEILITNYNKENNK